MAEVQDNYFIPSSYSRIIARELGLQERQLATLLLGTGLSSSILMPGDETRLSGRQQLQVLDNGRRMSASPDFGLRLGRQLHPSAHGPLGYLVLSSPNLLAALESLRDFLPTRLPLIELELAMEGDWLRCSLKLKVAANSDERRILNECFALVIQSFVESMLGRELSSARIELTHERPQYHRLYDNYLHSPVQFSCSSNSFLVAAELAGVSNASGDPGSYALAYELCQKLLVQVPASVLSTSARVRRLLLSQTPSSVSEADVASAMFISKRTLARRLDAEGSSYRAIREQLLSDLAARHLCESGLTVEAVSALLGYNDTAAFRKAFRRWYGESPTSFRQRSQ
ncbi:MAG: AraC family transcriptional regulator ligand-binding domain-containing protein [Halioglobus sp.]